ncbi:DNA polymerase III, delta subunit [Fictibacillus solisalsi]|uniref:DNA polymerase III subunit delta n=1 Tax=Fictibacillus solisalsi TaxID=459525 RepID=A0A1G9WFW2_9BACL|nr:DNA polymerase III subunit delta [Fictibacillus solisalsi]SDM83153.1 DNA polymerase III, delta subunit [Fictibacillus solisalsi]
MSISALQKNLKQNQFAPYYVLYGTESYIIEQAISSIVKYALNDEDKDFNYSAYDYQETPVQAVMEDAETLPFMGDRRVVVIKNALFLTGAKDKSKVEHDLSTVERYIQDPADFTILVFVVPAEKLDERKKIVKTLKKNGEVLSASPLSGDSAIEWIKDRAMQQGVFIDADAAQYLSSKVSNELMALVQEMDKLALYVGEGNTISIEVIDQLVPRTLEDNIFSLIDDIVHKKIDVALRTFYDLMKQNEEPIKILSLMARQFRIIFGVKELFAKGYGEKQIAGVLKLHPYAVKLASRQARMFDEQELFTLLDRIAEADYEMKTGKMDKQLILELIMLKMAK